MSEMIGSAQPDAPPDLGAVGLVPTRRVHYDPEFEPAVAAGLLSVCEAIQRGKRQEMGERLATRHKIPLRLALEVADNRISLQSARAQAADRSPAKAALAARPVRSKGIRPSRVLLLGASIGVVAALAMALFGPSATAPVTARPAPAPATVAPTGAPASEPQAEAAAPSPPRADVVRDALGRLTRVEARNPASVLVAFCENDTRRQPVGMLATRPVRPNLRLAVFRTAGQFGSPLKILRIHRRHDPPGWVAGDGTEPILVRDAPRDLDEASIRPVR